LPERRSRDPERRRLESDDETIGAASQRALATAARQETSTIGGQEQVEDKVSAWFVAST